MEDQSKNPFIDQKTGRQNVNPYGYGHNPPIHKLKSGNKYPNNILDKTGSKELDSYYQEPEVKKFFRDNDNKIWSRSEGPGGLSDKKYFSNPYVKIKKSKIEEGKGDAIRAAKMLGKKLKDVSPKLLAKTKEFLRNQRSGLKSSDRGFEHLMRKGRKTKGLAQGNTPKDPSPLKGKYMNMQIQRKSIHPPTADAAQTKFIDRKVELIKSKNNRRREKERLLKRMFDKG